MLGGNRANHDGERGPRLSNRFASRLIVTLSESAMGQLAESGGHSQKWFGLEDIDEVLEPWAVHRIRAPFGAETTYDDPELRRLARTFTIELERAVDLANLSAELLQLEAVEEVEYSDPRYPVVEAGTSSAYWDCLTFRADDGS